MQQASEDWFNQLEPILDRVKAKNLSYNDSTRILTANVYGREYSFKLNGDRVEVSRGDLKNYFLLSEIESIDHISMPYIIVTNATSSKLAFSEQKASDIDMRLHLVMEGDICAVEEMVIFVNAGTQRSKNYIQAR